MSRTERGWRRSFIRPLFIDTDGSYPLKSPRFPGFISQTLGVLALAGLTSFAYGAGVVSLSVDATQSPQMLLHAREVIPVTAGPMALYYPKWIPGEHGPDGPIANLTGLRIEAGGKTIPWRRDMVDVFKFHLEVPAGVSELQVSYDYLEPQGMSASDKVLALEWNEVVLYPADVPAAQLMYQARLTLPAGWKYGTAMSVESQSANQIVFKPISLEMLVDSPVIAGEYYRVIDLTPPGEAIHHEIDLVADSQAALAMSPAVQKGLTNLVAESGILFGARHYREYHFLLTLSDHVAHFGLEHHDSNDSRLPERVLLKEDEAGRRLGALLPHEFAHSWNGKFRRPADIATPNFEVPMKDELLWGYEGLTDFLGPLLAARSGLFTPEQYREYLASTAASLGPGRPGRKWRPLVDTAAAMAGPNGGNGWTNWRRTADYYDEGNLLWLEVATIINRQTKGQKSIDDFCRIFHGGANRGGEVKPYTFDELVRTLNDVAPYDWAGFFEQRVNSIAPDMPDGGIRNSGWRVEFNDKPVKFPGRHGAPDDLYSIGLQLAEDGAVQDSLIDGPAFKAGISPGMKVVGINGRLYKHDLLEDAIKASKDAKDPISVLVTHDDYYRTCAVDYHGGPRYPHLVRDESKPDLLDEIAKPRAAKPAGG
jgi:predicted metalloprotease with PDZ domain